MYHQRLVIKYTQFIKLHVNLRCLPIFLFQQTEPTTPVTASQVSAIGVLSPREVVLNLKFVIAYYIAAANCSNITIGICSITQEPKKDVLLKGS